jgi:predicted PurR-regulated permease PerM
MGETSAVFDGPSPPAREGGVSANHTGPPPVRPEHPAGGVSAGRIALVLIAIVLMVGVVTYLGPILKPFLVAVFLFFSTKAAAGALIRRRCPPALAYVILFVGGSVAAAAVAVLAYGEVMNFRAKWPDYQEHIQEDLVGKLPDEVRKPLSDLLAKSSQQTFEYLFERGVGLVELLGMTFFYLLFILLGAARLPERVRRAFPDGAGDRIVHVADQIGASMERFMQVKTVVSLGIGLSAGLLTWLFGLRGWLLWGLLFFALNYVTYVGSIAACVPPMALAFLDLKSPAAAATLAVLIVLNRIAWIDYIEVKMTGRQLNVDSILLFLWLAYWGWLWGVVGLVLAFPMVTGLKIVLEHLEATKGWAVLMSED